MVVLMLLAIPSVAQWGNKDFQEKGDVLGRDLGISPLSFFGHTGIFTEYTSGDPSSRANSDEIEMLGPATNAIVNQNVQAFISASLFRGAFQYLPRELNWQDRRDIVSTITAMKNRPTPIDYVPFPYYNKYLNWTERDSDPQRLTLDDIDRMRSDAVVEFAYAENGFPILRPNLWRTIINSPAIFKAMASSNALTYLTEDGLIPMYQLFSMMPSNIDLPQITVYDANASVISPGGASSMTTVSVYVTDQLSGPGGLQLFKNGSIVGSDYFDWPSTAHLYTAADIAQLGSLTDGEYSIRAIDQASNYASFTFVVDTDDPDNSFDSPGGPELPDVNKSTNCPVGQASRPTSGIKRWTVTGPGGFLKTATFPCPSPANPAKFGPICLPGAGDYVWTSESCAGKTKGSTRTVEAAASGMTISFGGNVSAMAPLTAEFIRNGTLTIEACMAMGGNCTNCNETRYLEVQLAEGNSKLCPGWLSSPSCCTRISGLTPASQGFSVSNATTGPVGPYTVGVAAYINKGGPDEVSVSATITNYTGGSGGFVSIPDVGQRYPISSNIGGSTITTNPEWVGPVASTRTCSGFLNYIIRKLFPNAPCFSISGSQFVTVSTATVSIAYSDPSPGVVTDTTTLAMYYYDGADWSSATVTNQTVSKSTTTGVITVSGEYLRSGEFGAFFIATDTTPPVTSYGFQGSSYAFDGTVFISTDAFIVLTATDPTVNYFSAGVASTVYRFDPSSADAPFSVYSASVPLSLGTHVFEYRSYDWFANTETLKTATFTVTAGTGFKNTGDHRVKGALLTGFLGSGAQAEVVSAAENAYTLMVSSVDRTPMLSVSNIGSVAVGPHAPEGRLDLGQGDVALGLRSGNATSTGTAIQMTFGYNGDYSMRHALRTRHSTSTDGNRMDFLLWSPAAGATTTVATNNVLSLQGITAANEGSFHVMPVGEPDAEVEVSNGSSLGGGTIQRREVLTPSSRRIKSDIRYLDARQEDAALDEISRMEHVRFRYKSLDGRPQPLNIGLIYEEAPESVRAAEKTLSSTERMTQVELALKAAVRRIEALEKRRDELRRRRRTP